MTEQKPMCDPVMAAKDRLIFQLRRDLERAERAAGRMASEAQAVREDREAIIVDMLGLPACASMSAVQTAIGQLRAEAQAHKADVLRLEALVERHGLNAAPAAVEDGPGASARVGDVVRCTVLGEEHVGRLLEWNATQQAFEVDAGPAARGVSSWLVSRERIHEIVQKAARETQRSPACVG